MSQLDLARNRNNVARLVRWENRSGSYRGVIRFSTSEGFKHFLAKCITCWELAKNDKSFICEGIFTNKKRCDILNLDDGVIIEVLNTEEPYSCTEIKVGTYPLEIDMRDADEIIRRSIDLKSMRTK